MAKKKHHGASATAAVIAVERAHVDYTLLEYTHDDAADSFGEEAAAKLGYPEEQVFKTLMVLTPDSHLAVAVVPVTSRLNLKAMAEALGVKKVTMADPALAEKRTGYVVGGISPLGQKRPSPTVIDTSAWENPRMIVSGGHRGLSIALTADDLQLLCDATRATISR